MTTPAPLESVRNEIIAIALQQNLTHIDRAILWWHHLQPLKTLLVTSAVILFQMTEYHDLVYRLLKRAEIRRNIPTRKSVQEGKPDRIADLLEEAAKCIKNLMESKDA